MKTEKEKLKRNDLSSKKRMSYKFKKIGTEKKMCSKINFFAYQKFD